VSPGTVSNGSNGHPRDSRGRFLPGNRGGPGNPNVRRQAARRAALERAVTTAELDRILSRLKEEALAGDADARKELLDRLIGKPAPVDRADALGFELPPLRTAADLVSASNEVLAAVAEGRISLEAGERLSGLIAQTRSSIEFNDLVRRRAASDLIEAMTRLVEILRQDLSPELAARAFARIDREILRRRAAAAKAEPEREVTPELPPAAGDGS
jgi:hypothetical protein